MDFSFQELTFNPCSAAKEYPAAVTEPPSPFSDLDYFNLSFGPTGAFAADTAARVVITRDSTTNMVTGYVNGVSQFAFSDSTSDATFTGTNGIIRFFEDDNVTGEHESSAGLATRISIYNGALTSTEVAALGGPQLPTAAPEPAPFLLLGTGLAGFAFAVRRRN